MLLVFDMRDDKTKTPEAPRAVLVEMASERLAGVIDAIEAHKFTGGVRAHFLCGASDWVADKVENLGDFLRPGDLAQKVRTPLYSEGRNPQRYGWGYEPRAEAIDNVRALLDEAMETWPDTRAARCVLAYLAQEKPSCED